MFILVENLPDQHRLGWGREQCVSLLYALLPGFVAAQLSGSVGQLTTADSNAAMKVEHTSDIEISSSTSAGAIQGYGYAFHQSNEYGPGILRLYNVTDFILPHLDRCYNGEIYNMIVRGAHLGGLDGIDVSGSNRWVHDVEVLNGAECVTVKPIPNIRIEKIFCSRSGGCAMGSLGTDTDISHVEYEDIYTYESTQMYLFKCNRGNGTVSNYSFKNFIGQGNAYMLDLDSYWGSATEGEGVKYVNLLFEDWNGTSSDGTRRAAIRIAGDYVLQVTPMEQGTCLSEDDSKLASYDTTLTIMSVYIIHATCSVTIMLGQLTEPIGTATSIDIPSTPTSFSHGWRPYKSLLGDCC
ncbi:pectin lyase fold/virulence factor [Aspergillus falconensis]